MGSNALGDLIEPEVEVLRILNGEDVKGWTYGAAMNACLETLKTLGYADGMYSISEKGKKYLENLT